MSSRCPFHRLSVPAAADLLERLHDIRGEEAARERLSPITDVKPEPPPTAHINALRTVPRLRGYPHP